MVSGGPMTASMSTARFQRGSPTGSLLMTALMTAAATAAALRQPGVRLSEVRFPAARRRGRLCWCGTGRRRVSIEQHGFTGHRGCRLHRHTRGPDAVCGRGVKHEGAELLALEFNRFAVHQNVVHVHEESLEPHRRSRRPRGRSERTHRRGVRRGPSVLSAGGGSHRLRLRHPRGVGLPGCAVRRSTACCRDSVTLISQHLPGGRLGTPASAVCARCQSWGRSVASARQVASAAVHTAGKAVLRVESRKPAQSRWRRSS